MDTQYPSRVADMVRIRLPDGMRAEMKSRAALARRTLNAEAVILLEAGYQALYGSKEKAADE